MVKELDIIYLFDNIDNDAVFLLLFYVMIVY